MTIPTTRFHSVQSIYSIYFLAFFLALLCTKLLRKLICMLTIWIIQACTREHTHRERMEGLSEFTEYIVHTLQHQNISLVFFSLNLFTLRCSLLFLQARCVLCVSENGHHKYCKRTDLGYRGWDGHITHGEKQRKQKVAHFNMFKTNRIIGAIKCLGLITKI